MGGNDPLKLWRQLADREIGLVEIPHKIVKLKSANKHTCLLQSPIQKISHLSIMDRIAYLLFHGLEDCKIDALDPTQVMWHFLYPPQIFSRAKVINPRTIRDFIQLHYPKFSGCHFSFSEVHCNAAAHFFRWVRLWQRSQYQYLIFGALDCLTTLESQQEAIYHFQKFGAQEVNAPALGEASAFMVLTKADAVTEIIGVGDCQNYTIKKTWPLCQPFDSVLTAVDADLAAVSTVYLPNHGSVFSHMHWYEVCQQLWPETHDNKQAPKTMHKEMLLGDIGVASFPVMLLLMLIHWQLTGKKTLPMLVELNEDVTQGVVMLKPQRTRTINKEHYENSQLTPA